HPRRRGARAVHVDTERACGDAAGRTRGGGRGAAAVTEVAIVTGAAQGLGAAIADALEAAGAQVGERASVERATEEVAERFGEPTILVNKRPDQRIGPSESLEEARLPAG